MCVNLSIGSRSAESVQPRATGKYLHKKFDDAARQSRKIVTTRADFKFACTKITMPENDIKKANFGSSGSGEV